jgi:hypothetical protein
MIWGDMVRLSRSSPAIHQCATFLPRRKLKKEAGSSWLLHVSDAVPLLGRAVSSFRRKPEPITTAISFAKVRYRRA